MSVSRAAHLNAQRALIHGARRRLWHDNLWPLDADVAAAHTRRTATLLACTESEVDTRLTSLLWRMIGAVVGDTSLHAHCGAVPHWNAERGAVTLQSSGKAVPRGSLIASWPGVSYLPTDVVTILHCGQRQFPDVAWLWRRQLVAQQAHLLKQTDAAAAAAAASKTPTTTTGGGDDDDVITRSDGVVFDASRCDPVARFVNPFALAHRIRVAPSGTAGNVLPVSLNIDVARADERLLPFVGNVPFPFGADDILSPSDNLLNTSSDESRDAFMPLLLFLTTTELAPDAELLREADAAQRV
jgi:hypothetical protein